MSRSDHAIERQVCISLDCRDILDFIELLGCYWCCYLLINSFLSFPKTLLFWRFFALEHVLQGLRLTGNECVVLDARLCFGIGKDNGVDRLGMITIDLLCNHSFIHQVKL